MTDKTDDSSSPVPSAVALRHDGVSGLPPKIVATGRGEMAKQILDIAFANGVKVRTDRDLVELLEKFEVDTHIPPEAFVAVAEILNYLYKLNGVGGTMSPFDQNFDALWNDAMRRNASE